MAAPSPWPAAPTRPRLLPGEVHVYLADVAAQDTAEPLDEQESARAARFAFEADRRRFVAAHAVLGQILSRYTGRRPAELRFTYGPSGKPALDGGGGPEFNMSHSGDLALYAVARGRAVGIDVERVQPEVAQELTAARFFTPAETEALFSLPEGRRARAFFTVWTRKEACLKATGEGLSVPLSAFMVWPEPDPPWHVVDLDVGPDYAAALAAQGGGWTLRRWRW
jgi:4'-phosphopantetheinyl transferase